MVLNEGCCASSQLHKAFLSPPCPWPLLHAVLQASYT